MKKGVVAEPISEYHAYKEALGSTDVKAARVNLEQFKAMRDGLIEFSSRALDIGQLVHSAVLEQDLSGFAQMPGEDGRTKEFKDAKAVAESEGKVPLKPSDFVMVERMFCRFLKSVRAVNMIDQGVIERSHYCMDEGSGLHLKSRPDVVGSDYIVNYKTTRDVTRDSFARDIFKYGYHISAAHEIKVIEPVHEKKINHYFFIVQEKTAPFGLKIYQLLREDLERARAIHDQLCIDIAYAIKHNHYPGFSDEIEVISVPEWAARGEEVDNEEPSFVA